jgi:hypothetical protein
VSPDDFLKLLEFEHTLAQGNNVLGRSSWAKAARVPEQFEDLLVNISDGLALTDQLLKLIARTVSQYFQSQLLRRGFGVRHGQPMRRGRTK